MTILVVTLLGGILLGAAGVLVALLVVAEREGDQDDARLDQGYRDAVARIAEGS